MNAAAAEFAAQLVLVGYQGGGQQFPYCVEALSFHVQFPV
jgi:hypothetical protein